MLRRPPHSPRWHTPENNLSLAPFIHAKQAVKAFGDAPYTIVQTQVPNSIFKGLSPVTVDGGIPAWVLPTDSLKSLVPKVMDHSALPPLGF